MSRLVLIARLASRDLARRPAEALLLLLAITTATATLSLGLVLHGSADDPYQKTREATAGPDVVASVGPPIGDPSGLPANRGALVALTQEEQVAAHSGPFPVAGGTLVAEGVEFDVQAIGRDTATAAVDQPHVSRGSWVSDGSVVVEAGLADTRGLGVGDTVSIGGRSFRVGGIAVSAAAPPYPNPFPCAAPCTFGEPPPGAEIPPGVLKDPGTVWVTRADAERLATSADALSYVTYLKLSDPATARAFVDAHPPGEDDPTSAQMLPWQDVLSNVTQLTRNAQRALVTGATLLTVLALASLAVLVGGRMADQNRRVGLLKAVGGTPSLVAWILLTEYFVVALLAAIAGLAIGRFCAPLLTDQVAGLIGATAAPTVTASAVAIVLGVALGVAAVSTSVPAVVAARASTLHALAAEVRPPHRSRWMVRASARLPLPWLLGVRIAARRPRRSLLGAASIAVTVSGIVAAVAAHADLESQSSAEDERLSQVLLVITIMLLALSAVNTVFVTWATVADSRQAAALTRALGASPSQVAAGLAIAQVLPTVIGAVVGVPAGLALFAAVDSDPGRAPLSWQMIAVAVGIVVVVAALTAGPARVAARRPAAEVLQAV